MPEGLNNSLLSDSSFSFRSEFTAEPVPPVRKKCGDTLLLGSNNSLIHLTTEKFKTSTLNKKDFTGQLSEPDLPGRYPLSPAIDLCIGRKKLELEELKNTTTDKAEVGEVRIVKAERGSLYSKLENYEIDKLGNLLDKNREFFSGLSTDFEATNCGARLYLSNNCATDETFGSAFSDLPALGGSSIVTYADHNRVIADNSLRLTNRVGQSFIDMNAEGKVRIQGNEGTRIELAVRLDNDPPAEPYILYSELRTLLADMAADIAGANATIALLGGSIDALLALAPPAKATYDTSKEVADGVLSGAGATGLFASGAKITGATIITELSPAAAGGRIGSGNTDVTRGTIASNKIFGE